MATAVDAGGGGGGGACAGVGAWAGGESSGLIQTAAERSRAVNWLDSGSWRATRGDT